MTASIFHPSRARGSLLRAVITLALLAGAGYAAAFVGWGLPLGRALASIFRDRRQPAASTWLEVVAGTGTGPDTVLKACAVLLTVAALAAAVGVWRPERWSRLATRVWRLAAVLAAVVTALSYLPRDPVNLALVLLPWIVYVTLLDWALRRVQGTRPPFAGAQVEPHGAAAV
jgi:hypothetical protein